MFSTGPMAIGDSMGSGDGIGGFGGGCCGLEVVVGAVVLGILMLEGTLEGTISVWVSHIWQFFVLGQCL